MRHATRRSSRGCLAVLTLGLFLWLRGLGATEVEGFGMRAEIPGDWVGRVAHPPAYSNHARGLDDASARIDFADLRRRAGPDDVLLLISDLERRSGLTQVRHRSRLAGRT